MLPISAADVVKQLRARFGLKGSTDLTLDERIIPVANLNDLDAPPFNGKRGFIGSVSVAGVAAQSSYLALNWNLTNEVGSALVVRQLILWAAAATNVRIGIRPSSFALVTNNFNPLGSWDSHDNTFGTADLETSPAFVQSGNNVATTHAAKDTIEVPLSATPLVLAMPFCLRRGAILVIEALTQNVGISAAFYGDQYPFE